MRAAAIILLAMLSVPAAAQTMLAQSSRQGFTDADARRIDQLLRQPPAVPVTPAAPVIIQAPLPTLNSYGLTPQQMRALEQRPPQVPGFTVRGQPYFEPPPSPPGFGGGKK